jgi:F-box/leucine-rich repeat protein 10/11
MNGRSKIGRYGSTDGKLPTLFTCRSWLIGRYCKSCLDMANDPTNPNRPHHPLAATTKANFPPRQPKRRSMGAKRTSPASSSHATPAPAKRAKLEDQPQPGTPVSANGHGAESEAGPSRPKRQAALNRPDYHALHHHIATPTAKWLHLIADPEKYNATILDGELATSHTLGMS